MLVRRGVATVAFAGLLSAPSIAAAQAFDVQPSGTISAGYAWSELIPINSTLNPTLPQSRPFLSLGPAIVMTYETPRTLQTFQTSIIFSLPFTTNFTFADVPPTYSGRAAYTNKIALSDLWALTSGLAFSVIPTNPLVAAVDAYDTVLDTTPVDLVYNFSVGANQTLTRELSPSMRLVQSASVTYNYPYNVAVIRPSTLATKGSIALSNRWPIDALTLALNIGYNYFGVGESTTGGVIDTSSQFLNTLIGTWVRSLTSSLTSSLDLGVLQAASPYATAGQLWQPTGGARLAYNFDYATASIGYTHTALVNVFTATVDLHDQVALRAAFPFGYTGFSLSGTLGFTNTAPITTNGTLATATKIYVADVGLSYTPARIPRLSTSLRGTYHRQIPSYDPLAGFTRLAVNVNIAFSFPDAWTASTVQRQLAPAYIPTPSLGSDGTHTPGVQPSPVEIVDAPAPGEVEPPTAPAPKPAAP
jgi:hypothetical protein